MSTTAEITLTIPDEAWYPAGDEDEPGGERAVLATVIRDEDVDHYYAACGASGSFETTRIGGAKYLVFVTPFD
ncbi:MAG: hypothetical protein M1522_04780 [Actinobacteria bacterium]|nr:hypothetical protein [Actinomycetota bacterium]